MCLYIILEFSSEIYGKVVRNEVQNFVQATEIPPSPRKIDK